MRCPGDSRLNECVQVISGIVTSPVSRISDGDAERGPIFGFYVADGSGVTQVSIPLPLDPAFDGVRLYWQAAQLQSGGPVFGEFAISNGTAVRFGCR